MIIDQTSIIKNQLYIMLEDKKPQLTPISELGEFGLIKHLTEKFSLKNSSTEFSVGDDAAIINPEGKKVVITTDVLAEGCLLYTSRCV